MVDAALGWLEGRAAVFDLEGVQEFVDDRVAGGSRQASQVPNQGFQVGRDL
jgi:hypothetical protein